MPRHSTQNNTQNNAQESAATDFRNQLKVNMMEYRPERGVLATADVRVGDLMTIRNVKIKEDDYGLTVTMPRTKMPHSEQYKDSIYFADKSMKEVFDQAVKEAYQHSIMDQTQEDAQEQTDVEEMEETEPEEGMSMNQGM